MNRRADRHRTGSESGQHDHQRALIRAQARVEEFVGPVPQTPAELHGWIERFLLVHLSDHPLIHRHASPMEYITHSFFEGQFSRPPSDGAGCSVPTADCIVWANRGGGKTFLGAIATLLDLVFKPSIQVRILAGSLDQGKRMHEHLRRLLHVSRLAQFIARQGARRINIANGSAVEILAASETSIRGTRPQKIRCDEVDLFEPDLWRAVLLTTRALECEGPWGPVVRGGVDALSTMQRPHGLMWDLVSSAAARGGRTVYRWGIVDTLEQCPDRRPCAGCPLLPECAGRAKAPQGRGHITINNACELKTRTDRDTWESEMLCLRPRTVDSVYPNFEPSIHVITDPPPGDERRIVRFIAGMDFGIRSDTAVLLASIDDVGRIVIEQEHIASGLTIPDHIAAIRAWIDGGLTEPSPQVDGAQPGISWIAIDPAGVARNEQTGISNRQALREQGFEVRNRRATIETGIRAVRTALAPADGAPPRLRIRARCTRLIEAIQRYHYPENRPEVTEPVKDGADHPCDALRYLVINTLHATQTRYDSYLND